MVAQLGNDPSLLEQQQQQHIALAHMNVQQQQLVQQQAALEQQKQQLAADPQQQLAVDQQQQQIAVSQHQLAVAHQQSQQQLAAIQQQLIAAEQSNTTVGASTTVGALDTTTLGAPLAHSSAMAASRVSSVLGGMTADEDLPSEDSLTFSPEKSAGHMVRTRAGMRPPMRTASPRTRKPAVSKERGVAKARDASKPPSGRARSEPKPMHMRPPLPTGGPMSRPLVVPPSADAPEARLAALEMQRDHDHRVMNELANALTSVRHPVIGDERPIAPSMGSSRLVQSLRLASLAQMMQPRVPPWRRWPFQSRPSLRR